MEWAVCSTIHSRLAPGSSSLKVFTICMDILFKPNFSLIQVAPIDEITAQLQQQGFNGKT
jgi:hypothetical protein